jgi:hypothetical protein
MSEIPLSESEEPSDPMPEPVEELKPKPLTPQEITEKNLGLIKVLDYIVNRPFDLIFQNKLLQKYQAELKVPLLGAEEAPEDADGGRLFLREEFETLKIENRSLQVIKTAEDIAAAHGIKKSLQKRTNTWNMIVTFGMMGIYFISMSIPSLEGIQTYIMWPFMFGLCLLPKLVGNLLKKSWEKFKATYQSEVLELESENRENLTIFTQDVLNDTRERLLNQHIALEKFQFILFGDEYDNVRFLRTQQTAKGAVPESIFQFEYPEGMAPRGTPAKYGRSEIPEDEANDEFIVLKNAQFNEEGEIQEFSVHYLTPGDEDLVEALLNASKFEPVDAPVAMMPTFYENDRIECTCNELIKLKDLKNCTSKLHANFEFYLAVGEKCTCGKNPFVLINSPGNERIPEGLHPIFK